jgi:nickel transport protein
MKSMRIITLVVLAVLLIMLCITPVSAHKAFVGAFLTGNANDEIQIKAWYEGGTPMANAKTTVYTVKDGNNEVYVEGDTDDQGFFTFEPEYKVTQYSVKVEQTGHRAKMDLDLEGGVSTGSQDGEPPLFARIIAGFGYLTGLAGVAMIYTARKMRKEA